MNINDIDLIDVKGIYDGKGGVIRLNTIDDSKFEYFIETEDNDKIEIRANGTYNYFRNTDPSKGPDRNISGNFKLNITIDKTSEQFKNKNLMLLANHMKLDCFNNDELIAHFEGVPGKENLGEVRIYLLDK